MPIRWLSVFLDHPGRTSADRGEDFWLSVTGSTRSARRGETGEFATLVPTGGDAHLRFQATRDGAPGAHLDLHVEREDHAHLVHRAGSLGASVESREPGLSVLRSPAGVPLCIVDWDGERRVPKPVATPSGARSRADQVCLSVDADSFEREGDFWSSLSGWTLGIGSRPEFRFLARPEGQPVRILLQRRAQPVGAADAHLDLACSDHREIARHHASLGARIIADHDHWLVMRDPVGRSYCLTARDPVTGSLA